jgi:hypothetical protein
MGLEPLVDAKMSVTEGLLRTSRPSKDKDWRNRVDVPLALVIILSSSSSLAPTF